MLVNRIKEIDCIISSWYQRLSTEFDINKRKEIVSKIDELNLERMELSNVIKKCNEYN